MAKKPNHQRDPLAITPYEHLEIIEDIRHSNEVRRKAKLPLIDENQAYEREAQQRVDEKYRTALEPYLAQAYQQVGLGVGFPARLAMAQQAWRIAEAALLAERGVSNPNPQRPNFIKTVIRYVNGTLASRDVS